MCGRTEKSLIGRHNGGVKTYREFFQASFLKVDRLIFDIDDKVAVSHADTTVTVYDFASGVFERWRYFYGVFEAVAVARSGVCLASCGWGLGGGHVG